MAVRAAVDRIPLDAVEHAAQALTDAARLWAVAQGTDSAQLADAVAAQGRGCDALGEARELILAGIADARGYLTALGVHAAATGAGPVLTNPVLTGPVLTGPAPVGRRDRRRPVPPAGAEARRRMRVFAQAYFLCLCPGAQLTVFGPDGFTKTYRGADATQ